VLEVTPAYVPSPLDLSSGFALLTSIEFGYADHSFAASIDWRRDHPTRTPVI